MNALSRLAPYLKPYLSHFLLVIASTIILTLANLAGPWVIRSLLELIGTGQAAQIDKVYTLAGMLLIINTSKSIFAFLTSYLAHLGAWNMVRDLRVQLYEHLQKLSLRYHGDKQTGELMSRIVNDTANLEPLLAHGIPEVIVNGLMLIGVSLILVKLNPILTIYSLIPVPLLVVAATAFNRKVRPAFKVSHEELAGLNALLQDNISGIKEIQAFTRESDETHRVSKQANKHTQRLLAALKMSAAYYSSVDWLASAGTVIIVFFGGIRALKGDFPVEDMVAFLLYLGMFYQPITVLARLNEGIQQALSSTERIFDVLDATPEVKSSPSAFSPEKINGHVEFKDVFFRYTPDIPVLEGISFTIEPGQTLALVGPTGVGKSTVAALVPRFYDATAGKILIDEHDIKDIDLKTLRQNIAMVLQDVFLFNGTVRDNLLYGKPDATDEELIRACRLARAEEFISELPDKYDTQIGERGVKLSGGQKQRLSIARAILKDAPILILDEATSAVDARTEVEIQEALQELMKNRTSIVIAHRLSTIRNAHKIAVLNEGHIAGIGTHQELLLKNPIYQKLHELSSGITP